MSFVIGIALTVAVIVVVAWPFFRSRRGGQRHVGLSEAGRLRVAREDIYGQIRQLESDRDAGLICEDEYSSHLRELRVRAAELMRAEEQLPAEMSVEDQLELEIEAARAGAPAEEGTPDEKD